MFHRCWRRATLASSGHGARDDGWGGGLRVIAFPLAQRNRSSLSPMLSCTFRFNVQPLRPRQVATTGVLPSAHAPRQASQSTPHYSGRGGSLASKRRRSSASSRARNPRRLFTPGIRRHHTSSCSTCVPRKHVCSWSGDFAAGRTDEAPGSVGRAPRQGEKVTTVDPVFPTARIVAGLDETSWTHDWITVPAAAQASSPPRTTPLAPTMEATVGAGREVQLRVCLRSARWA